ncbi:MAG: hypothetical protein C5B53_02735 [Candidatus Melainabacteria bacterium]|nr:MAG: hypothetical protein C5B53_02735 [Candidatus Melainabacteria bacterium]
MVSKLNRAMKNNPSIVGLTVALLVISPGLAANGEKGAPGRKLSGYQKLDNAPAFPVPIYTGNVLATNFVQVPTANGLALTATTRTGDEPSVPFAWYQNFLSRNDWTIVLPKNESASPAERNGNLYMLKASKDKTSLLIICSKMQRSKFTTVNVTAMQSK